MMYQNERFSPEGDLALLLACPRCQTRPASRLRNQMYAMRLWMASGTDVNAGVIEVFCNGYIFSMLILKS